MGGCAFAIWRAMGIDIRGFKLIESSIPSLEELAERSRWEGSIA